MKPYFAILIILIFLSSCNTKNVEKEPDNPILELTIDSMTIDIRGEMEQIVKLNNRYYCIFKLSTEKRDFYILDSKGNVEFKGDVPGDVHGVFNYDLYVHNNCIHLKTYSKNNSYSFDRKKRYWKSIAEQDDLLFEDEDYSVTYINKGEWGDQIWFRNKRSKQEYKICLNLEFPPFISRVGDVYYITTPDKVYKIGSITALKQCGDGEQYEYFKGEKNKSKRFKSFRNMGVDLIFGENEHWYIDDYESFISTSFVNNNQLYHLYNYLDTLHVGILENNQLKSEMLLGEDLRVSRYYLYQMNRIRIDQNQIIRFLTSDEDLFGFIDLNKHKIHVCYIRNKYPLSPKPVGIDRANEIFRKRLGYIVSHIHNMPLNMVEPFEQEFKSENITPFLSVNLESSENPQYENIYNKIAPEYRLIEDSVLINTISYNYSTDTEFVNTVFMLWVDDRSSFRGKDADARNLLYLEDRYTVIKEMTTNITGVSPSLEDGDFVWKTANGVVIKLLGLDLENYRNIRMIIKN